MSRHKKFSDRFDSDIGGDDSQGNNVSYMNQRPFQMQQSIDPFSVNIADVLDKTGRNRILSKIGGDLKELIDDDYRSGEEWRNSLAEGINQLGVALSIAGQVPESAQPYEGSSAVYSTSYIESFLQFTALYRSELLPPAGPADIKIPGETNDELEEASGRIKDFMNLYFTDIYFSAYEEWELAANWAYIAGSSFKMVAQDPAATQCRPISPCIWPTNIIVNNEEVVSLENCRRITHKMSVSRYEFKRRQYVGFYRDCTIDNAEGQNTEIVKETVQHLTGFTERSADMNKTYDIWDVYTYLDIEGFNPPGVQVPYIVSMDSKSSNVLRIVPNYYPGDPEFTVMKKFVQNVYQRGFGLYGMGMSHIAAGLAKSAAEIKRLCINTAELSAFPGGFMPSDLRTTQSEIEIAPNTFNRIQLGGRSIDEVLKLMPYRDPSAVLKQLGDDLEQAIKDISAVNNMALADFNANAPVGTTVALLETSHKLQASYIARLHKAMGQELDCYYKFFAMNLRGDELYPFSVTDQEITIKQDFSHGMKLIPISDPNNNSSYMRIIKNEALLKLSEQAPELHKRREIYKRIYKSMSVSDIDSFLLDPEKQMADAIAAAVPLDVISETQNLLKGVPTKADIAQDHASHIAYLQNFGMKLNPETQAPIIQATQLLVMEHEKFGYLQAICHQYNMQLAPEFEALPPQVQNIISQMAAQKVTQEAQAAAQSKQPDATEVMATDVQNKAVGAAERLKLDYHKAELDLTKAKIKAMTELQREEMMVQFKNDELMLKQELESQRNRITELNTNMHKEPGSALQMSTLYPELKNAVDDNQLF